MFDSIVIGGGISGLFYAHFAKKRKENLLLIEAKDALGGCISTLFPYPDFFVEAGSHTIYSSYATFIEVIEDLGLRGEIRPHLKLPYLFHYEDNSLRPLTSELFSPYLLAPLVPGIFKLLLRNKAALSVKDYYGALGKRMYNRVIRPATSAVICQDADDAAAELLLKSRPKNKTYPRAFTLNGGLGFLIQKVAEGTRLKMGEKALGITFRNSQYLVKTPKGEYPAKKVVLAVEPFEAAKLLPDGETKSFLSRIEMKGSTSFTYAAKLAEYDTINPFSYIISTAGRFRGLVSRDVLPSDRYRGGSIHIDSRFDPYEVFNDSLPFLSVTRGAEVFTKTTRFYLPQLKAGHRGRLAATLQALEKTPNFVLLGNFFDGLSMEDCALRAKKAGEG